MKEIRNSSADLFITALNSAWGNSKITWKYIKKTIGWFLKNKTKIMQIRLNGNILTQVMADVFNDQFSESVTKISDKFTVQQRKDYPVLSTTQPFTITNKRLLIKFNHSNHQKQRPFLEWTRICAKISVQFLLLLLHQSLIFQSHLVTFQRPGNLLLPPQS